MSDAVLLVGHEASEQWTRIAAPGPLQTIRGWLASAGYEVTVLHDGHAALRLASEGKPGVVIVADVMPPDENADGFVRELRALPFDLAIITLTPPGSHALVPGWRMDNRLANARGDEVKERFCELASMGYVTDMMLTWPCRREELLEFVRRLSPS